MLYYSMYAIDRFIAGKPDLLKMLAKQKAPNNIIKKALTTYYQSCIRAEQYDYQTAIGLKVLLP